MRQRWDDDEPDDALPDPEDEDLAGHHPRARRERRPRRPLTPEEIESLAEDVLEMHAPSPRDCHQDHP